MIINHSAVDIVLRYQPPFRTVRARIAVTLVVFIKTPINHIFFKSLIIPDYGLELTKTIYLNVFRNWNALCKSTRLYKSCSTPAGNKQKKGQEPDKPVGVVYAQVDKSKQKSKASQNNYDQSERPKSKVR